MKELTVDATIENVAAVTAFVDEQLEQLDCPMVIWHTVVDKGYHNGEGIFRDLDAHGSSADVGIVSVVRDVSEQFVYRHVYLTLSSEDQEKHIKERK